MQEVFRKNLFLLIISFVVLFTFWDLPRTFYQQDEWQTLGHNLVNGLDTFKNANPFLLLFGELRPMSSLIYLFLLGFFQFTVVPAAIFAIVFQVINAALVFYLVDKISKKKLVALVASLFLITNSVSHQAVTWVSAVGTLPAATLILLAIIMYVKYLEKSNKKYLLISLVFTILSLYFKGTGIFLFVLLPLMNIIYNNKAVSKKNVKKIVLSNSPFFISGLLIILVRFGQFFFRSEKIVGYSSGAGNSNFVEIISLRAILYPLTSLFQVFVPPLNLYSVTPTVTKMQYKFLVGSPLVDLIAQSIVADMIAVFGSVVILGILGIVSYKLQDKTVNKNIIFAFVFFVLSFLPYVVLDRDSSYLSSRYFYVGTIAAGIIFGYIVYYFSSISKYMKWLVLSLVIIYFLHHVNIIRGDIAYQVRLGNERKAVLNGIKELKPTLDKKTVFYVTSDKEYYGPITNPFQNGLGYVLEVWYYDSGKIPKEFLSDNFLWDLGAEGYRESGDKSFGYFQNVDKLVEEMEKNKLKADIVHAFFIKSQEGEVLDITADIRGRISTISAIAR